jgi:HEPN domain-containing protein
MEMEEAEMDVATAEVGRRAGAPETSKFTSVVSVNKNIRACLI